MKKGKILNKADLASLHGVSLPTIDSWIRKGCPFTQRGSKGKEWQFDSAAIVEWLLTKAVEDATGDISKVSYVEAKRRKVAAQAALAEYELAERRKELISVEDVIDQISKEYSNCRSRLFNIPSNIAPILVTLKTEAEIRDRIRAEISEALSELTSDNAFGT
jgi:terminase small subunit / prophage DNA-packing protein